MKALGALSPLGLMQRMNSGLAWPRVAIRECKDSCLRGGGEGEGETGGGGGGVKGIAE